MMKIKTRYEVWGKGEKPILVKCSYRDGTTFKGFAPNFKSCSQKTKNMHIQTTVTERWMTTQKLWVKQSPCSSFPVKLLEWTLRFNVCGQPWGRIIQRGYRKHKETPGSPKTSTWGDTYLWGPQNVSILPVSVFQTQKSQLVFHILVEFSWDIPSKNATLSRKSSAFGQPWKNDRL